jgi:hypothetical protein
MANNFSRTYSVSLVRGKDASERFSWRKSVKCFWKDLGTKPIASQNPSIDQES